MTSQCFDVLYDSAEEGGGPSVKKEKKSDDEGNESPPPDPAKAQISSDDDDEPDREEADDIDSIPASQKYRPSSSKKKMLETPKSVDKKAQVPKKVQTKVIFNILKLFE
jgi:hypothetical protein